METVGRNKKVIEQYKRNQLEEDFSSDQISLTEYIDLFVGNKNMWAINILPRDMHLQKCLTFGVHIKFMDFFITEPFLYR